MQIEHSQHAAGGGADLGGATAAGAAASDAVGTTGHGSTGVLAAICVWCVVT
jgi:hypothetical protein